MVSAMKKSIREFDALYPTDCTSVEDYESLKRLMIDNLAENRPHVLTICSNSKNGDVGLQATNYVGVIGFSNGNCLEIMPKIASVEEDKTLYSNERSKIIFLEMLTFSRYSHKELVKTGLGSASTDILEYFIQRYADDVRTIIKQGVASSYYNIELNDRFLRGTIDFPNHIRNNTVHQERFYIRTQLFGQNRPENRIIKSTLLFLYRKTNDSKNKRELNDLLCYFEEIPSSIDI